MSSYAKLGLSDEDMANLRNEVYKGYTRIPMTRRALVKSQGWVERPQEGGGTIDYGAYGGQNKYGYQHNSINPFRSDKTQLNNAINWKKVADHIGIEKINSENDLRQMYDFVSGYKFDKGDDSDSGNNEARKETDPTANTERPDNVKEDRDRFLETKLDRPENQMPRLEDAFRGTTDASMGAIRGGDDLNEHYQKKFVPHLEADARATSSEIGDESRNFLSKFTFDPPELGSIKDIFDKYKSEIEDLD